MRTGECNGCSACCRFVILQVNPAYMEPERRRFIELHGVRLFTQDGGVWAQVSTQCQHLLTDGKCGVYGKPERPKACAEFPFVQTDIDLVDTFSGEKVCSYSFEKE